MNNELKIGACINYIAIALNLATSLFLTPFIIQSLGLEEYGIFMLSNTVIVWLTLTDLGFGTTVSKYIITYRAKNQHEQQAHFLGQSILLYLAIAIITSGLGFFFFFKLDVIFPALTSSQFETLEILYLLTLGNLILAIPMKPLGCIPGAYQKFVIPGVVQLIATIIQTSLIIVLLLYGFKSIGLTVLMVVMNFILLVWRIYYSLSVLGAKIAFKRPDWALYREMLGFSIWVFMNQIMDLFYWKAGAPVLANTCGVVAVALFTMGISFSRYFMTASTAISGVVSPKLMHMVAEGASKMQLTEVMIKAGRLQLCVLMIILLGFVSHGMNFLSLWVGDTIQGNVFDVWLGALIVLVPLMLPLTQNVGIAILQSLNIHKGRAIILFYSSLICVVLGAILSMYIGVLGMFIGTAISLIVGQGIMINIYYQKKAGLHIDLFFRKTFLPIALPTIILSVVGYLFCAYINVDTWGQFFISASIYGAISMAILFILYLNPEEKRLFLSPFKKLFKIS